MKWAVMLGGTFMNAYESSDFVDFNGSGITEGYIWVVLCIIWNTMAELAVSDTGHYPKV